MKPEIIRTTPEDISRARKEIDRERGAIKIVINGYRRHLLKLAALERKLDRFEKRPEMFRKKISK